MTSRVEDRLAALELVADRSAVIYYATSAAGDTTFAAGYTTKTGAVTPALVKSGGVETDLMVAVSLSAFYNASQSRGTIGAQVGGADYDLCLFHPAANSVRVYTSGRAIITGLAAGSYTAQLRGKSTGGAAVFRLTAGDDFINLAMWEVGA
jgi:hypothetical protein